jgi:predicted AAA+ superfamily ATPase
MPEDAKSKPAPHVKYDEELKRFVQSLLNKCSLPRDALPYTDEFAVLKRSIEKETGHKWKDSDCWQAISSIAKGGGVKGARRKVAPRTPTLSHEQQLEVLRLLPDGIGNRDSLPYTPEFEEVHRRFNHLTRTNLTSHEFWRGVSRVSKLNRKPRPILKEVPLGRLSQDLVDILERTNPWWMGRTDRPDERFRRWAFDEVLAQLKSNTAPVVAMRGPRQVGKTTLQKQIIEHLLNIDRVPPERILRVQFDDVPALGNLQQPVEAIVRWFEENILRSTSNTVAAQGGHVYLFFDELQNMPKWSEQLKSLADHAKAKIFVTGSSALRIAKGRDSLAGRISTIELGPLRLYEIAGIRNLGDLPPFAPHNPTADWLRPDFWNGLLAHAQKHRKVLSAAFAFFSERGAYPVCHKASGAEVGRLADLVVDAVVRRTVEHDPVGTWKRRGVDRRLLAEVFRVVCRYAGQAPATRKIAEIISGVLKTNLREPVVDHALRFLTDAMLVHQIEPLQMLLRRQANPSKLCLCDHFVRNAFLQEYVPLDPAVLSTCHETQSFMAGHIIESVVGYYLSGIPGLDVNWAPPRRGEEEIDFIGTVGTRRLPIEIKYQRTLCNKDILALDQFCGDPVYEAKVAILISQTASGPLSPSTFAVPAPAFLLLR